MGKSAWVVSLTPFREDGAIDEVAFRTHLRRLSDAGQSIYVGSTNVGEGFALEEEELRHLLAVAVDELGAASPLRAAGVEARSIREAVRSVRIAEDAGIAAIHVFQLDTGHGTAKPDVGELERYYSAIIETATIPVVLSNYPSLGYTVPLPLVERLVERFPQIVAFRDSGGDLGYFSDLVTRLGDRIEVYAVGVRSIASALMLGADAIFTTEANVAPRLVSDVLAAFERGDISAFRAAYGRLVRLQALLGRYGGSAGRGMKPLLSRLGAPAGVPRPPRGSIGESDAAALSSGIAGLNLPEWSGAPAA